MTSWAWPPHKERIVRLHAVTTAQSNVMHPFSFGSTVPLGMKGPLGLSTPTWDRRGACRPRTSLCVAQRSKKSRGKRGQIAHGYRPIPPTDTGCGVVVRHSRTEEGISRTLVQAER